ncbi:UNVERIFIED_CONTAM: hypothetical protein GTU68_015080 [Idotea baltica]|nr:hypothetical protein [Idotea baltica]
MKVYQDKIEEYKLRHNPIWPELQELLKNHGVHNYSIFLDRENFTLFGYAEIESEEKWNAIGKTAICKKWWTSMKGLMETNEDNSPVSMELEEVFFMS